MTTTPDSVTSTTIGSPMIDRAAAEATIYRVAVSAFTFYPAKPDDEPAYVLDEDVDWCLAELRSLPAGQLDPLRQRVRDMITDPASDRRSFIAAVYELAGE